MTPRQKAAYRREEKRLLLELAKSAVALAQPRLNYAELYLGRLFLAKTIGDLIQHTKGEL
jgi:hypothetical protein